MTSFHNKLLNYFEKLLKCVSKSETYSKLFAYNYFLNILKLVLNQDINFSTTNNNKKVYNKECAIVKQYIDENYAKEITVSKLSQMVFLSNEYLIRSFKKNIGMTPIAYLKHIRIEKVKLLLETTTLSITQIYQVTGFLDQSYFCQMFKKSTGFTPNKYRAKNKQKPF